MVRQRRPSVQWTTLLISFALAGTLGVTLYLSTTSLPYLASSTSADPLFGALNACLHHQLPVRSGFAVARDARSVVAWSTTAVVRCRLETDETPSERWEIRGVTVGALDHRGNVWLVVQPGGLQSTLMRVAGDTISEHGETGAKALVATENGIVLLEESGRLVAVSSEGEGTAVAQVPPARSLQLRVSGDGRQVAVVGEQAIRIFDSTRLTPIRAESPCDAKAVWWLKGSHQLLLDCASAGLSLLLDSDTGAQEPTPQGSYRDSYLVGPEGPYVEACDLLPCTSPEPSVRK